MQKQNTPLIQRLPRLSGWLVITVLLAACVWSISPHQLPVSLYKLSLVSMAAVVGYWLDRSLFPYARPDTFMDSPGTVDIGGAGIPEDPQTIMSDCDCVEMIAGPGDASAHLMGISMLRRAIIIGCAMLAMGLGA
jgi:hypothetical protein